MSSSVAAPSCTMRLPDKSSGSAAPRFSRHSRTSAASLAPIMIRASEPPMKSRRPSYDFVHTGDFMASSTIENGVCYRAVSDRERPKYESRELRPAAATASGPPSACSTPFAPDVSSEMDGYACLLGHANYSRARLEIGSPKSDTLPQLHRSGRIHTIGNVAGNGRISWPLRGLKWRL